MVMARKQSEGGWLEREAVNRLCQILLMSGRVKTEN